MREKIWTLLVMMSAGCGEVTAEPIQTGTGAFSVTDIEVADADSNDTYACEVLEMEPEEAVEAEISLFVSLPGVPGFGGRCKQAGNGALNGCWYTGDLGCGGEARPCGGFSGRIDTATGAYMLEGGQHMVCEYPCDTDEECPAPSSGTALATCMRSPEFNPVTDGGSCMLGCGNGEVCPDGFVCIDPGLGFGLSDGSTWMAPAQCVQYKPVALESSLPG